MTQNKSNKQTFLDFVKKLWMSGKKRHTIYGSSIQGINVNMIFDEKKTLQ